jgi:hypothetical protein
MVSYVVYISDITISRYFNFYSQIFEKQPKKVSEASLFLLKDYYYHS